MGQDNLDQKNDINLLHSSNTIGSTKFKQINMRVGLAEEGRDSKMALKSKSIAEIYNKKLANPNIQMRTQKFIDPVDHNPPDWGTAKPRRVKNQVIVDIDQDFI